MSRTRARRWVSAIVMAIGAIWAPAASAQTPVSTSPSPAHRGDVEFAVGVSVLTPVPMGSRNINLTASNGLPFTVANTSSKTGLSMGLDARVGFRVRNKMAFELAGAWDHVRFQTSVAGDVEGAAALTSTTGVSRLTVGGAMLFTVQARARKEVYAVAGASWMREASQLSSGALYADGALVEGGAGVKIWWRDRAGPARVKRLGLRLEGRVGVRTGGITLDTKSVHLAPAFVASLMIGS